MDQVRRVLSDQETLAALRSVTIDARDAVRRTTVIVEDTQKMIRIAERIRAVLIGYAHPGGSPRGWTWVVPAVGGPRDWLEL
jgi:hypothetical protein